jgi:hypothetical protein
MIDDGETIFGADLYRLVFKDILINRICDFNIVDEEGIRQGVILRKLISH